MSPIAAAATVTAVAATVVKWTKKSRWMDLSTAEWLSVRALATGDWRPVLTAACETCHAIGCVGTRLPPRFGRVRRAR